MQKTSTSLNAGIWFTARNDEGGRIVGKLYPFFGNPHEC
jgi:hypothetical protein